LSRTAPSDRGAVTVLARVTVANSALLTGVTTSTEGLPFSNFKKKDALVRIFLGTDLRSAPFLGSSREDLPNEMADHWFILIV